MKKILIISLILLISITLFCQKKVAFVSIENLIEQEVGREIIPEIYKKLGIEVEITPRPGKRAQAEATSGVSDGEIMRIYTYGEENPTTVRVPTPYYKLETMAFIQSDSDVVIKSKDDLAKYSLAKVSGVKHTNNITVGIDDVYDVYNTEQMIKMLNGGRVQVALTNTVDGLLAIEKLGYKNIKPIDKPLAVLELFNYIHESKKHLVPKVDAVINEMKESGELDKLIKQAEKKVIDRMKKK